MVMRGTDWMVKLLQRYGNCYIRKLNVDLDSLAIKVGAEITINKAVECNGYILKVKK